MKHLKVKVVLQVEFNPKGLLFFDRETEKRWDL